MADAKKAPPAAKPKKKKGGKLKLYFFVLVAIVGGFTVFPVVVVVLAGLVPTIVAFVVDKDNDHSSATAVGAMNCAGLTPFVIDLVLKGPTMGNAFQILANPNNWLFILGAAAVGQMIVFIVPQALATLTLAHSEMRIKNLNHNLELLRASWGQDVGTLKPIDKLVRMD